MHTRRVAVIDVGTNSVRLLLADVRSDGTVKTLSRVGSVTRLGEGAGASGMIAPLPEARTTDTARGYAVAARDEGAETVLVTGTSALRTATNGPDVAARIGRAIGLTVRILSGDEEARAVFRAVGAEVDGPRVVIDIGGGSTEITRGANHHVEWAMSTNLGVVTLNELFAPGDPPDSAQRSRLLQYLQTALPPLLDGRASGIGRYYGVGGTMTALATIDLGLHRYTPVAIEGHRLRLESIRGITDRLWSLSLADRMALPGVEAGRADVVLAGSMVLHALLEGLGAGEVTSSTRGLRYGILLEWVEQEFPAARRPPRFLA